MPIARCARVLLAAACLLLAIPAAASAATYIVDNPFDTASGPGAACGDGEDCSLRAALEQSNATVATEDTILFDETVFEGQSGDTIQPATMLPGITSPVLINGGTCLTAANLNGPCVGVEGPSGESVLRVEADDVSIYRLAIGGGLFGVAVLNASKDFILRSSWIGFNLEGGPTNNTNGVFLDPGSNGATIGGEGAIQRNVFGNNGNGLDVEGASETTVQGNYFGVRPDGTTPAANFRDIEVSDSTASGGFEAKDTVIGATVSAGAAETVACDGGCNVIANAAIAMGIDLQGDGSGQNEAPTTGPTTIQGNYVGIDAAGTGVVGQGTFGINAGEADDVLVGGSESGAKNFVAGGAHGIYGEKGDDLVVVGNAVGFGPNGAPLTPPTTVGVAVYGTSSGPPNTPASVVGNVVRMLGGVGIEQSFTGAEILENEIEGGGTGILTKGEADGSLIEGNAVVGSEDSGIVLRNPENKVFGNEVVEAGEAGIEVTPGAAIDVSGNIIGGDSAADENAIFESGDNAIRITGIESSFNEARRNRGSGNGAEFIVIRPYNGPEGDPNGGIQSPDIAAAAKSEANGTAEAGAVVRVFRKASSDPGEIAGFLGSAVADGSGSWKATYAPQPEGTIVVATQTLNGGSSSLSETATTPPDPPAPPSGCPAVPSACPPPPPPPPVTKPTVKIKKGPKAKSKSTTAKFVFSADQSGVTFKCKLDKKAFANCKSPKTYKKLKPGKHVFKVKATNSARTSPVVTRKFTVLPSG